MSRQEVLENLKVYESMRDDFEAKHLHKWVVFADKQLVGIYDTNVEATSAAIQGSARSRSWFTKSARRLFRCHHP